MRLYDWFITGMLRRGDGSSTPTTTFVMFLFLLWCLFKGHCILTITRTNIYLIMECSINQWYLDIVITIRHRYKTNYSIQICESSFYRPKYLVLEAHGPQIVFRYNYSTGDYQSLYWHSCANRVRYLLATHEAVVISSCSKTLNKYIKLIQPHRWSPRP